MSPTADRASLLDRLVAADSGNEDLRTLFAESPLERLESAVRDYETARAEIARRGRLAAEWADPEVDVEDDPTVL